MKGAITEGCSGYFLVTAPGSLAGQLNERKYEPRSAKTAQPPGGNPRATTSLTVLLTNQQGGQA